MTKQKQFLHGSVLVFGLFAAGNAAAASVGHMLPVSITGALSGTSIFDTGVYGFADPNNLAGLPQFNSSMGILEQVSLRIDGHLTYDITIAGDGIFDANEANSAYADATVGITAAVPVGPITEGRPWVTQGTYIGCFDQEYACEDTSYGDFYPASEGIFLGADMDAFKGVGDLSALSIDLIFGLANPSVDNLGDALVGINSAFLGNVTVTYTYSEVPLPAAAWLFGSALLGLGVIKRRKA